MLLLLKKEQRLRKADLAVDRAIGDTFVQPWHSKYLGQGKMIVPQRAAQRVFSAFSQWSVQGTDNKKTVPEEPPYYG